MTKATMAGEVGDVEQFVHDHPEGLAAATHREIDSQDEPTKQQASEDAASSSFEEQEKELREKLVGQAEAYIKANPLKAIGYGVLAGLLLDRILL